MPPLMSGKGVRNDRHFLSLLHFLQHREDLKDNQSALDKWKNLDTTESQKLITTLLKMGHKEDSVFSPHHFLSCWTSSRSMHFFLNEQAFQHSEYTASERARQREICFICLCSAAAHTHSDLNKTLVIGGIRQTTMNPSLRRTHAFQLIEPLHTSQAAINRNRV